MTPAQKRLVTRRELLRQIKAQVYLLMGEQGHEVNKYLLDFEKEFRGQWIEADTTELLKKIQSAAVVLGSDFHAYAQSQRSHLRILRSLPENTNLTLALECFRPEDDIFIEKYLQAKISEKTLLKKTDWQKQWGFPWSHYKPLVDLCKQRGFKLRGLDKRYSQRSLQTLKKRDEFAAKVIHRIHQENSNQTIYVIFGELHLAQSHLPLCLKKFFKSKDLLILFQDSDKLYMKHAQHFASQKTEVLKTSRNRFCLLASPPWVKWQSYLIYLERTYDVDLAESEGIDYLDEIVRYVELVAKDLGIKVKPNDLSVFGPEDSAAWQSIKRLRGSGYQVALNFFMRSDRSFFIPQWRECYLSRHSINHAASLAGQYLHSRLSGLARPLWKMPEDFLGLVWVETMGYFASKLVNHKRKTESLEDIQNQLTVSHPKDKGREALKLVLDQRLVEFMRAHSRRRKQRFKPKYKESYFEAAKIIGHQQGERLYSSWSRGLILSKDVLYYFHKNPQDQNFATFYYDCVGIWEGSV